MNNPENSSNSQVQRDEHGRYVKGCSGNLAGPPKGYKTASKQVEEAIERWNGRQDASFWDATVDLAMNLARKGNTNLLGKIIDKFIPDLIGTKIQDYNEGGPKEVVIVYGNSCGNPLRNESPHS